MLQKVQTQKPSRPFGLYGLIPLTVVWVSGAVWSFREQTAAAEAMKFAIPWLLPLTIDGLFLSLAIVAFVAALDGRAAIAARLMTVVALAASSASNAVGTYERVDTATGKEFVPESMHSFAVALALVIPMATAIALEVLLGELRRQVQRSRGLPAPVAIPQVRIARLILSPRSTFTSWRTEVLRVTAIGPVQSTDAVQGDTPTAVPPVQASAPVAVQLTSTPAIPPVQSCTDTPVFSDGSVQLELTGEPDAGPVESASGPALPEDDTALAETLSLRAAIPGQKKLMAEVRSGGASLSQERAAKIITKAKTLKSERESQLVTSQ